MIAWWLIASVLAQAEAPVVSPDEEEEEAVDEYVEKERVDELEDRLEALERKLQEAQSRQDFLSKVAVRFSGYLDFGFFWVAGNGSGVRPDTGHTVAPELEGQLLGSWVLVGDPLSTSINSRGDVADVGDARAIRFDPVHAGGRPSFLVNALNLGMSVTLGDSLSLHALLDFLPRDRDISSPNALGDLFDLKLAFVRYQATLGPFAVQLDVGKVDSLLGIEYRNQEAPDRITVTPSVVCRYTCGRPVGLRGIARFANKRAELALALTNGSHQADWFVFQNEQDFNRFKTVTGRVGYRFPLGRGLELNVNGSIGPQDRQSDDAVLQWHAGVAAQLQAGDFDVVAEAVMGEAQGKSDTTRGYEVKCGAAQCLQYRAAYGLVAYRATSVLQPYVRADFRTSRHRSGDQFAYIGDVVRATAGVRLMFGLHVIVKAEYTVNHELAGPAFPNDVFTSSLVVKY